MKIFRLKPDHPALQRIEEVFAFMEERGVSFEYDYYGVVHATVDGQRFRLRDLEHRAFDGSGIPELPPGTEYAVLIDEDKA